MTPKTSAAREGEEPDDDEEAPAEAAPDAPAAGPLELLVPATLGGLRLDRVLAELVPDRSRASLQRHIEEDAVTMDGALPKRGAKTVVPAGARLVYRPPPPAPLLLEPEDIPLTILFEDEHLLAIDKPAGLVVHPGHGHRSGTLVNAVLHHVRQLERAPGDLRPGIVHRLDQDTTGVMVVAKHPRAHERLSTAFAERRVEKRYLAMVRGAPRPGSDTIDTAFGRHPHDRKRFSSRVQDGKRAVTHYEVLEFFPGAAWVQIALETGRTHQIRVHFADRGHPLVGDETYGRKASVVDPGNGRVLATLPRPALHARRLSVPHPETGAMLTFEAPVPADLVALRERLLAARATPR